MSKFLSYPEYKPSNIDWLGDIPKHWNAARLRHILMEPLSNGLFKKREHWGDGVRIVNVFDVYINGDVVLEPSLDRVVCDDSELKKYSLKHGDFVFVRSSLKLEGIGKAASVLNPIENLVFECHLVRGRPDTAQIDPKFLCYFLNSEYSRKTLVSSANQVTMATLDQQKFKNIGITFPSIVEQKAVTDFLDYKTAQIDALILAMCGNSALGQSNHRSQAMVSLLQEYRISLITHAVTGKIDVRNFKIPATFQGAAHA